MIPDGFAGRLAYVRWLENAGRIAPESDRALAARAGVGYEWLKKWMKRDKAPAERTLTRRLVIALGAGNGDWLLDNRGPPPEPDLWRFWLAAEGRLAAEVRVAEPEATYLDDEAISRDGGA